MSADEMEIQYSYMDDGSRENYYMRRIKTNRVALSRLEYLSNKEIAARLQISENTVEQQMRKALKILRSTLLCYDKEFFMLAVFHLLR